MAGFAMSARTNGCVSGEARVQLVVVPGERSGQSIADGQGVVEQNRDRRNFSRLNNTRPLVNAWSSDGSWIWIAPGSPSWDRVCCLEE